MTALAERRTAPPLQECQKKKQREQRLLITGGPGKEALQTAGYLWESDVHAGENAQGPERRGGERAAASGGGDSKVIKGQSGAKKGEIQLRASAQGRQPDKRLRVCG